MSAWYAIGSENSPTCVTCKHCAVLPMVEKGIIPAFRYAEDPPDWVPKLVCLRTALRDVVTGRPVVFHCQHERAKDGQCGDIGKLWEPKA